MSKFLPQNWNDVLSLLLVILIPALWWKGNLQAEVNGALILAWGNIIQYYFRRSPQK